VRSRRELLRAAGALGALALSGRALAAGRLEHQASASKSDGAPKPPKGRLKLSLGEWAVHRALQKGELDHLDFVKVAAHEYGLSGVDYVNTFFKDKARDAAYLADMRRRAQGEGVESVVILIDGEGNLGDADPKQRELAIEQHKPWIDAAHALGCRGIRVNLHGEGSREDRLAGSVHALRALAALAEPAGLQVMVENHGGLSSDGSWVAAVMHATDRPGVGTLPDFGNFTLADGTQYDRYQGVRELMPWAKNVSVKSRDFDERGEETTTDYAKMLGIVVDSGYSGWLELEYEGERLSEHEGIVATKKLVLKVLAALGADLEQR
jgi:L-ribulose-5-phosphate 3-epimerase